VVHLEVLVEMAHYCLALELVVTLLVHVDLELGL
jgi:hypothetical protein